LGAGRNERNPPNCDVHGGDPQCPVYVDTGRSVRANSGLHRASVNFLSILSRSVPELINAVIDEALDKWGFAGKLSSEWRKQSERNEGDDGRQMGLWTTE
jgi:hypothetical protein